MAGQLLLINPRGRRRKAKRKSHRRGRKMSALQMKYFGGGRARHNPRKRRRSSVRRARSVARRSYRRASRSASRFGRSIGFSMPAITSAMKTAAIGAGGAIAVDALMGQANRFLPADWQSRLDATGSVNWKYYVAKGALAIGAGVVGARFGGRYRGAVLTGAQGALMVMAYEILREYVPQDFLPLGFYTNGANASLAPMPTNVTPMGKYLPRATPMRGMGVIINRQQRIR